MSIGLAFFHGWGLDRRFWHPLAALLSGHPHTYFDAGYYRDRGDRGDSPPGNPACAPDFSGATQWVAVGHSLGWARALQSPPPGGWAGTVSLCGFTRFCAQQPGQPGQDRRVVDRMLRVFERTPHAVLNDFLARCGLGDLGTADLHAGLTANHPRDPDAAPCPINAADTANAIHTAALAADLALLRDLDLRDMHHTQDTGAHTSAHASAQASTQAWASSASPVLALAAQDDAIVSAELTQATFGSLPHATLIWHPHGGHALGYAHAHFCAQAIQAFLAKLNDEQNPHQ